MAIAQRRVFRIERYMSPIGASEGREQPPVASNDSGSSNKDVLAAIADLKAEIAELKRAAPELSAVVDGTENATEAILSAAENIEQLASNLAAAITDESMNNMACDVQDHVVKIFEACNFQDLTGQRVSKVITSFKLIEERVHHMMEIWGGIDSFADIEPDSPSEGEGDKALLNGPALAGDIDVASQDDIDALFD